MELTDEVAASIAKVRKNTSASAITAYDECPRRWWMGYALGMKQPTTEAMQRGTDIHDILEHYLKTGVWKEWPANPHYVDIAKSALPFMPERGPQTKVEEWIAMPLYEGGPPLKGKYDAIEWGADPITLTDYKTTSSWQYMKMGEQLKKHIQLNIYGKMVLDARPEVNVLKFRLIYLSTAKRVTRVSKPSETLITRAEVEANFAKTADTVREMMSIVDQMPLDIDDVTPNTASCSIYGGCFYQDVCAGMGALVQIVKKPNGGNIMDTTNGTSTASNKLLERLARSRAEAEGTPAEAAPAPVAHEAKVTEPAQLPADFCTDCEGRKWVKSTDSDAPPGAFVKCKACNGTGARHAQVTKPAEPAPEPLPPLPKPEAEEPAVEAQGIVPPDAPSRVNEPGDEPVMPAKKEKASKKFKMKTEPVASEPVVTTESETLPPPPATTQSERVQRTETSGYVQVLDKNIATDAKPAKKTFTLYIDAQPTKGPHAREAVDFETWLEPIERAVEKNYVDDAGKAAPVQHWRLPKYARGEATLAAAIRDAIPTLPDIIVCNHDSKARDIFLATVVPWAGTIVRGV